MIEGCEASGRKGCKEMQLPELRDAWGGRESFNQSEVSVIRVPTNVVCTPTSIMPLLVAVSPCHMILM